MKKAIIVLAFVFFGLVALAEVIPEKKAEVQVAVAESVVVTDTRGDKIDNYFKANGMPLQGYGKKFVEEADKNGIDWRLLAAISVKESSGGKHMIKGSYNAFGWGSGTLKFKSFDQAIEYISDKLGNGRYYKGKSTQNKLKTYNPPNVEPLYSNRVTAIMSMFK